MLMLVAATAMASGIPAETDPPVPDTVAEAAVLQDGDIPQVGTPLPEEEPGEPVDVLKKEIPAEALPVSDGMAGEAPEKEGDPVPDTRKPEWTLEASVMPMVYLGVSSSDEANTPVKTDAGIAAEAGIYMRTGCLRLGLSVAAASHDIGRRSAYRSADLLAHAGLMFGDGARIGLDAFYGPCLLEYDGVVSVCQSFGASGDVRILFDPLTVGFGLCARFSFQEGLARYFTQRNMIFVTLGVRL